MSIVGFYVHRIKTEDGKWKFYPNKCTYRYDAAPPCIGICVSARFHFTFESFSNRVFNSNPLDPRNAIPNTN